MKRNTKAVGDIAEAMIAAALLRAGYTVLKPIGDNERYDLVIDDGNVFLRVQCKSASLRGASVMRFRPCSTHHHRGGKPRDYRGQADMFGVYCAATDKCYLVPVDGVGVAQVNLRIDDRPIGRTAIPARYAKEFEIGPTSV